MHRREAGGRRRLSSPSDFVELDFRQPAEKLVRTVTKTGRPTSEDARMARHNREGRGLDQRGHDFQISYQPDWLRQIKVTRSLESGRQSTKTLFRNPEVRRRRPGARVRTRVVSSEQGLDFEVVVYDPRRVVTRVIVETVVPGQVGEQGKVAFQIDDYNS
jgi:hypothetical protein